MTQSEVCVADVHFAPSPFTGKERDSESTLDNFGARYDASGIGRFMTPDWSSIPVGVPYASISDPQSLNLHSYVSNNPLRHKDSDGGWPTLRVFSQGWEAHGWYRSWPRC